MVTPPGGLACHLDAMRFIPHLPQTEYPAGALAAAAFIVSGIRGMERGTISMDRDEEGNDVPSDIELVAPGGSAARIHDVSLRVCDRSAQVAS